MVGISSAGIGSGLDIEGIISSLMAAERIPLTKVSQNALRSTPRFRFTASSKIRLQT